MLVETIDSRVLGDQVYRGEFKFSYLTFLRSRSLRTATFFPMPNLNIGFCFEISYKRSYTDVEFILIKLKLLALCAYDIPQKMKLRLRVGLNFIDGSRLHRFRSMPGLTTDEMKLVFFDDLVYTYGRTERLMIRLWEQNSFIILCHMRFLNYFYVPWVYNDFKDYVANNPKFPKFGELSDFRINIGEKSLPAHRAVLLSHSPVFRNMFYYDFSESLTNTMTITDSTFEEFECFLKCMYTGEIEDQSWSSAGQLYVLAHKYMVLSLKTLTGKLICSQLSLENVCDILNIAFFYDDDDRMKKEAVGFAARHLRELLPTNDWRLLVARHPLAAYEAAVSNVL